MPRLKDLTGQRFGRLTVIKKAESKKGHVYWQCKCDCGSPYKIIAGSSLSAGKVISCGCFHKEIRKKISNKPIKDLTNQKFGLLTAITATEERTPDGGVIWLCSCECGGSKKVPSTHLVKGYVSSCGCLCSKGEEKIKNILTKANIPFEQQKMFNDCIFEDTKRKARFDFYVNNSYLIEFDGEQHFNKNNPWYKQKNDFAYIKTHDTIKNNWAKSKNIPLIRIPYNIVEKISLKDLMVETSSYLI